MESGYSSRRNDASAHGTVIRASWLCLASNDKGGSKPGSSLTPVLGRSENASPSRSPTPRAMSMLSADTPTTCNSIAFKT